MVNIKSPLKQPSKSKLLSFKALFLALICLFFLYACTSGKDKAPENSNSSYSSNEHLKYGAPSTSGTILTRTGYVLSYNKETKDPNWVSYHLTADELNSLQIKRSNKFAPDPNLPAGDRAELSDYRGSGFDRGHMCPNADQAWSKITMKECFYLSNMCPQLHSLNAGEWEDLEKQVRKFTKKHGEAWIICGPVFSNTPNKPETIGANQVWVPAGFFKVVIYDTKERVMAIGFEMPHQTLTGELKKFIVKIRDIEAATGLNFMSTLPQNEQDKLETVVSNGSEFLN